MKIKKIASMLLGGMLLVSAASVPGLALAQGNNQYTGGSGGSTVSCPDGYSAIYGTCVQLGSQATGDAPTASISLNATTFQLGDPLTVTWTSSGASSCDLSLATGAELCGADSNCSTQGSMSWNTSVIGNHGITVTCFSDGGKQVSQSVNYTVNAANSANAAGSAAQSAPVSSGTPPTVSISLNATTFQLGNPLSVTWTSSGASSCDVTFADGSSICTNGPGTCLLNNTRTWNTSEVGNHALEITCTSDGGKSASQSVNYSVNN